MPMFGEGGQLPPWLQQQEDPTGNPWSHVNNTVRALLAGGLRRQGQQGQGQGGVPGQSGFAQPHFDVPLSGPYAKPGQTMPTTSDPAVMPPVPFLGAGGLPGQGAATAPTAPSSTSSMPSPQSAVNWMLNTAANDHPPNASDALKSIMSGNFNPPSGQLPSTGETLKSIMSGDFSGLNNIFGGLGNLFGGGSANPAASAGSKTTGGFA